MPLIQIIAGAYTATYQPFLGPAPHGNPVAIGTLSDAGFELSWESQIRPINKTDSYGTTFLDGIRTGGSFKIRMMLKEFPGTATHPQPGSLYMAWPWIWTPNPNPGNWQRGNEQGPDNLGFGVGAVFGFTMGTLGDTLSNASGTLSLTNVSGTTASGAPATLTADFAVLSPNFQVNTSLSSKIRELPLEMTLLPYQLGFSAPNVAGYPSGSIVWFTTT